METKVEQDDKETAKVQQSLQSVAITWKGFLSSTSPQAFPNLNTKNVIKISLGSKHSAYLTDQHAVYCYGSGEFGQLGHKKFSDVTKQPVLVQDLKGENVVDVVCGSNHTAVLCSDGIVFCWGDSSSGQCGNGQMDKIHTPQQVQISDLDSDPFLTQISCGDSHTSALSSKGEVWSWGTGPQLGLGTGSTPVATPRKVQGLVGRKVLQISCGANHSLALVKKVRSMKLGGTRQSDMDEEGSGSGSLMMTDEIYSLHEEGDIVIITDTRMTSSLEEIPSVRSFSPDSIDVAAREAMAAEKEASEHGSVDSNNSQGTYTLDNEKHAEKKKEEPVSNGDVFVDETDSTKTTTPPPPQSMRLERKLTFTESFDTESTKKYLAEQLKPLQLSEPQKPSEKLSPKDRILASLPQAVASKITKLISPLSLRSKFSLISVEGTEFDDSEVEELMMGGCHQDSDKTSDIRFSLEGAVDDLMLQTEVWSWGKGGNGQLGQGDPLERAQPLAIKQLSGKGVTRVIAGQSHSMAVASNGQVFSWGSNSDGQLGHNGQLIPKRIKMPNNALVWDAAAGSTHTLLLADGNSFQPDIYYLGKQPSLQELKSEGRTGTPESSPLKESKDSSKKRSMSSIAKAPIVKYAARAKQPEKLTFIRKCGWAQYIAAASDLCACITDKNVSGFTSILHELAATERLLHYQLSTVRSTILKAISSSEINKVLESTIYQQPFRQIAELFSLLGTAVANNSIGLTAVIQRHRHLADLTMLKSRTEYQAVFEQYANYVCDFVTIGGFTHMGKVGSDALSKHDAVFMELLNEEKPASYGSPLRSLMKLPLDRVKFYSYLLGKLSCYYAQDSTEFKLLKESSSSWETLQRSIDEKQAQAEETRTFWESCPTKLTEAIKRPDRRVLRDSRNKPLSLHNAGRLSQHWFLLFADIFVHAQTEGKSGVSSDKYASHQVFPLALIWAEPGQQSNQNTIQLTMPEATLTLQTPSPAEKADWLWSINQAIDALLTNQKLGGLSPVTTPMAQKIPPKLTRQGRYAFSGHSKFKDAVYEGVWHLGKPHGKGTLIWPDGKKYNGQFVQGQQHGYGVYTIPSAEQNGKAQVYDGQWQESSMSGYGTLRYSNGDIYQGNFQDGRRHGHGIFHSSVGNLFIGEWQNDCRHGYGIMEERQRGEKYMGKWENNCRHGNGMVITMGGLYYEGVFNQNKLMGVGILLTEDGTVYEGELTTGPTLSGKGLLRLPSGDVIDGSFSGLWGDGVKVNGTFRKAAEVTPSHRRKTSGIGKFTVASDDKWEDVFDHVRSIFGLIDNKKPDYQKVWAAVAVAISSLTQQEMERLHKDERSKVVEDLQKIPSSGQSKGKITEEDYKSIQEYLTKAFETSLHPLGSLLENLCVAYRETYIGLGAHRWLLPYAVQEIKSYVKRIYQLVRVLFSDLPSEHPSKPNTPVHEAPSSDFHYYYDYSDSQTAVEAKFSKSASKNRQPSSDDITCHITSDGLLYPIVLPRLYPALFTLYALKNEEEDQQYQERLKRLNERPDMALMAYLKVDQKFWLLEDVVKDSLKRISEIRDVSYITAVECLQNLSTTFSPRQKLLIIHTAWEAIEEAIQTTLSSENITLGMDELFPIFQYVVTRARIPHLGSELQLINDLMEVKSDPGQWGHMFTTLEACYLLTRYDKLPEDCAELHC
ncbi:alsin-like isoform X1 [Asterias rubens]|uniref:alsin-like isoform X1 n=1 Tax=Asterias rubens TaxID=7604 RepID=UPI0014550DF9|nr:alsin-like isoform X1 [Asterias rubens]